MPVHLTAVWRLTLLDAAALALRQVAGVSPQTQKACLSMHAYVQHAMTQACVSTCAGGMQLPDGGNTGQRTLAEVLDMKAFGGHG